MTIGFVKHVLSGDTVILMGKCAAGPPPEIQLSLASLRAPRLNRDGDEPFAWQSRSFLQQTFIGKTVNFTVEYEGETNNRKYGNFTIGSIDACKLMVENGWASVVKSGAAGKRSASYDELVAAETAAKASGVGIHTADEAAIAEGNAAIERQPSDATQQKIFEEIEGKPVEAVVDYIRDGSSLRILLPSHGAIVSFNLAGVLCPRTSSRDTGKPAPFALQAKLFVERRLLSRRVNVRVGHYKNRTFHGKVEHPRGDISCEILKRGLGKLSWTSTYSPNEAGLKKAEASAKAKKAGIFRNYRPPAKREAAKFEGVVSQVQSGDTLVVTTATGAERKITLSSIRTAYGGRRDVPAEPWSFQAKEFLRSSAVGRKVSVTVEYSRTGQQREGRPAPQPREFATVLLNGKADQNLAANLVGRGLAEVVNHRAEDKRSAAYDQLLKKQDAAEKGKKGRYSADDGIHRSTDLCSNASKAKRYLTFFRRAGQATTKAVVEYCFNGARMKLYVAKENCTLMFALAGVRCPNTARKGRGGEADRPGEPLGEEAAAIVKAALLQRDVAIEVDNVDDRGTFLGSLFAKIDGSRENLSLYLLRKGLAKTNYSADRSPYGTEMFQLQSAAKQAKIGIWEHFVERKREEDVDAGPAVAETYPGTVTHIEDATSFFICREDESAAAVRAGMAAMLEKYGAEASAPTAEDVVEPTRKAIVGILFDGEWCRAQVDFVHPAEEGKEALAEVTFVDYGNKDVAVASYMRPLEEAVAKLPASARAASLAFVKTPAKDKNYGDDAGYELAQMVYGQAVTCQDCDNSDGLTVLLTLGEGPDATLVNEQLVALGYGRYKKAFEPKYGRKRKSKKGDPTEEAQERIRAAHKSAAAAAVGMFAYGDFDSDDDPKRDDF